MDTKNILDHFAELNDPREDNIRHLLIDIIAIVICASICSAETWEDIEAFAEAKSEWLARFLTLPNGIPSHDTMARVFSLLDPAEFNKCFLSWIQAINPQIDQEMISIDGKTLRHSFDTANGKPSIHMVSAWANKAGMVLGQIKTNEKSNEITAIPDLLSMLEINGCIITIDAMGTQKAIAEKIIDKGGDYVLALKGNQSTLRDDVELYFKGTGETDLKKTPFDYYKTVEKDHGRIEKREYFVTDDTEWISTKNEWKGLRSIVMVKSERNRGTETSLETFLYFTSLKPNAELIGAAIRSHWGIENSLHWVLDIAFREDDSRKRKNNSAEIFAILRHLTLNLLKCEKTCKRSIAGKRLLAGWDASYLERVLFPT
jgi:predicted transposase YbfD/YdcC